MNNEIKKQSDNSSIEREELLNKLYWSIWIRIGIVTVLIGGAALTYQHRVIFHVAPWLSPLIILVILFYIISLLEFVLLRKRQQPYLLAYLSTTWDVLFVSTLVIATGGIDSIYTFFYLFVAIEGGVLLSRKGALIFASASAILYGLIIDIQFYHIAPSIIPSSEVAHSVKGVLINLITYITATYIVGILSAYLSSSLLKAKSTLSLKSSDLKQLTNLHSIIINSIDSGLITLDKDLIITSVNPAALRIIGYKKGDIIGKAINTVMPGIQLNVPAFKRNEMAIKKRDGNLIQVGYNTSNLFDDSGEIVGTVIIFQDLTEMKKMEARLKRADILATAGRLAASVAHEIRNPLASISGAVQLLIEDLKGKPEFDKPLELIFREVDRINNLVTEFLYMSKPVTNIQENVMLKPLIDEVFENIIRRSDYNPSIKLQTSVDDTVKIKADKLKLKQALLNLVLNALHSIKDKGNIHIGCTINDGNAIISVEDNGEGMTEDEIKLSLEPFWTKNPGGTGLGLPVVQSIVEQHNGTLSIRSQKNKGTVVTIKLPL
ncbi:MAG: two-component system sensor histidine kinase NtrB [bacterium]